MRATTVFRELDALVAERVMGYREWTSCDGFHLLIRPEDWERVDTEDAPLYVGRDGRAQYVPNYSTRIADAWLAVEHLTAQGWTITLAVSDPSAIGDIGLAVQPAACHVTRLLDLGTPTFKASAETAPEAICRVALRVAAWVKEHPRG